MSVHPCTVWPMPRRQIATLLLAAATLCACSGDSPTRETSGATGDQVWFEDVTAESGLGFEHVAYDEQSFRMPECVGAGIALIDFDGDGDTWTANDDGNFGVVDVDCAGDPGGAFGEARAAPRVRACASATDESVHSCPHGLRW